MPRCSTTWTLASSRAAAPVALWLTLLLVLAAALFLRADNLGARSFSVDEVLHVFAARGVLEGREPSLPSGEPYRRALPVTYAVAAAIAAWGESEASARIPSVVAGVLGVLAMYVAGAALFGRSTGLLAALLLAFSPDAVAMSRFVRMYAPVQLLALLAALCLYLGLEGHVRGRAIGPARRGASLLAGALLFAASVGLHPGAWLVLLGVGAYVAAMVAVTGLTAGWRRALGSRHGAALAAGLACAGLVLAVAPDRLAEVWRQGMTRLPWFDAAQRSPMTYHYYMTATYGYLWTLSPAATVAVLVTAFRPGLYLAALFFVPFVCLSAVVPTQSARYVFLVLPFLLLLLAEAGRLAGALLWGRLAATLRTALPWPRLAVPLAALLFAGSAAVIVRGSPWFAAAQSNRLRTEGEFTGAAYQRWREAAAYVARAGRPGAAIVATYDHLALYYFGRVDGRLLYRHTAPHATDRSVERTTDGWRFISYRTGAPSFTDLADLVAFVERHPRGWLVLERHRLDFPDHFAPGVRRFVETRLEACVTPADASLAVFRWDATRDAPVEAARKP